MAMTAETSAAAVTSRTGAFGRLRALPLTADALQTLAITAVAQGLALALQVLLARSLGPAEFGVYSIAIAWLGLSLIVAKTGLDTALVRLVAGFRATGDTGRLAGAVRFARRSVLVAGSLAAVLAIGLGATGASGILAQHFLVVLLAAATLPIAAWSELNAAALRGLRRLALALAGDGILRPVVAAAVLAVAWFVSAAPRTAAVALAAWLVATAAAALLTGLGLRAAVGPAGPRAAPEDCQAWRRLGLSLMVANGALVAMYSVDALLLGLLGTTADAGLFSVASRVALFVLFVMNAAQVAGAPRIAAAAAVGDRDALRSVVRQMNVLAVGAALPTCLGLAVGAEWLLGLFGEGFAAAGSALRILVAAQLLNVLTGPTGLLLSMGGRERELAGLVAGGLTVQVALACWLIPRHGIEGAAIAGLIAHTAWNAVAVWRVRQAFGLDPTAMDLLRRTRSA